MEFGGQHAGLLCVSRQGGSGDVAPALAAEAADGNEGSGSDGSAAEEGAE